MDFTFDLIGNKVYKGDTIFYIPYHTGTLSKENNLLTVTKINKRSISTDKHLFVTRFIKVSQE